MLKPLFRLLDVLNLEEIEEANKSSGGGESDGGRSGKSEEPKDSEECEGKTSEDRIRVCLPKPSAKGTPVKLPTAKIEEEAVCLDVSRAICNETSAVLSREVCTYEYNQADVLAPVQSAELTFRPRVEKLGVTRCHVVPEKHGYRTVEVEKCVMEFIDAPYILPDIAIKVDDFLQLQLPEPEKRCSVFNYELPEVLCGEHTRHQCVNVAHLVPYQVGKNCVYCSKILIDNNKKTAKFNNHIHSHHTWLLSSLIIIKLFVITIDIIPKIR